MHVSIADFAPKGAGVYQSLISWRPLMATPSSCTCHLVQKPANYDGPYPIEGEGEEGGVWGAGLMIAPLAPCVLLHS